MIGEIPEELWRSGAPTARGTIYLVRSSRRRGFGLCAWSSTADRWCIHWTPGGEEENHRHSTWPKSYRHVDLGPGLEDGPTAKNYYTPDKTP